MRGNILHSVISVKPLPSYNMKGDTKCKIRQTSSMKSQTEKRKKLDYRGVCGDRLRLLRKALGYPDIAPFAKTIGVTTGALNQYELGNRTTPPYVLHRLMDAHNALAFDWVYGNEIRALPGHLIEEIRRIQASPNGK